MIVGSIKENIVFGNNAEISLERIKESIKFACLDKMIDELPNGIDTDIGLTFKKLSGGQKQRIAIARAIASQPKVLLADEPTGALDSTTSEEVMALIKKINKEGKTILVVTHEHEIANMCNRIITLKDGVIVTDIQTS